MGTKDLRAKFEESIPPPESVMFDVLVGEYVTTYAGENYYGDGADYQAKWLGYQQGVKDTLKEITNNG